MEIPASFISSSKIVYRKVIVNEIEQYHQIRLHCLKNSPQNFGTLYEEELGSSNFKFDRIINEKSETDFLMGAFIKEKLVGICGFIREKREKTRHTGEISSMYVMPEFTGQRIGFGLLNAIIELGFDDSVLENIILSVVDKNQAAKNLYNKLGFIEYGKLKNYFKYGEEYENLVFMTLTRDEKNNL